MSAKVVPIRKSVREKEYLFIDTETDEVLVQTDAGKVPFEEWKDAHYEDSYRHGYRQAAYHGGFLSFMVLVVVISIYLVTFFYQTQQIIGRERIIGERDFLLLHNSLDLESFRVFNP